MAKYAWADHQKQLHPDATDPGYGGKILDGNGIEIDYPITYCNEETGEVWFQPQTPTKNYYEDNGVTVEVYGIFQAPLRYVPKFDNGTNQQVIDGKS